MCGGKEGRGQACVIGWDCIASSEAHQRPYVPLVSLPLRAGVAAGVWLGVRLQLLAALLVASVAGLAVLSHQGWLPGGAGVGSGLAASLAGLSLAYALPIVGVLDGLLTYSSETEQVRERGRGRGGRGAGAGAVSG